MGRTAIVVDSEFREALAEAYIVNDGMNQIMLEYLDPRAWRLKPPGDGAGARPIVAIVTHMHNIRRKWIRLSAPKMKLPAELDRARCTQKQARTALADSARRCAEMIREALAGPEGKRAEVSSRRMGGEVGRAVRECLRTWLRTTRIIEGRCACLRINWDTSCR